ncbi:hypothetical protein BD410DRAFT_835997 [Rickenella mellea]|uniref:N-acetyltransferase domain-containing protein n=1 Tax=Rickenella mellea TaxID=50990 RepID=A0A4Y7QJ09_9AGAM|nr:hypothetical protein BD410DRAFT_835997 [Rickenella mellea]
MFCLQRTFKDTVNTHSEDQRKNSGYDEVSQKRSPESRKWEEEVLLPMCDKLDEDTIGSSAKLASYLLQFLAVAPESQGKGIGKALVTPIQSQADKFGIDTCLETATDLNSTLAIADNYLQANGLYDDVFLDKMANIAAQAFAHDPSTLPMCGGDLSIVPEKWRSFVRAGVVGGEMHVASLSDRIEDACGFAVWYAPGQEFLGTEEQKTKTGFDVYIKKFGPLTKGLMENTVGSEADSKMYRLQFLAVSPDSQRRGVAKALMGHMLQKAHDIFLDKMANIAAQAFVDYPSTLPQCGGDLSMVPEKWRSFVRAGVVGGEMYVASLSDRIEESCGFSVWYAPGQQFLGTEEQKTTTGFDVYIKKFDEEFLQYWNTVVGPLTKGLVEKTVGSEADAKMYHLQFLAVSPDSQRRGVAKALMGHMLQKTDAMGVDTALETATESDVSIYERMGYVLKGQVTLPLRFGDFPLSDMHGPAVKLEGSQGTA